jgi:uncharacterized OB-fold protein
VNNETSVRPAVAGWFAVDDDGPYLIGGRCERCGTYCFPPGARFCPNPDCEGEALTDVPLSRTGTVWSYTDNRYRPPEPYVSPDPFVAYTLVAVTLEREAMTVLGQLAAGFGLEDLRIGMPMRLVVEPLFEDSEGVKTVWRWRPEAVVR